MWLTVARKVVTVMILLDLSTVLSEVAIEHHIMSFWYPPSLQTNKECICSQCVMKIPQIAISNITTPADPGLTRHCSWHCSSISLLPTSEMWQLLPREPPVRGYGHINSAELGVLFVLRFVNVFEPRNCNYNVDFPVGYKYTYFLCFLFQFTPPPLHHVNYYTITLT